MYTRSGGRLSRFSVFGVLMLVWSGAAWAQGSEMERLAQCDRDLCDIIRTPAANAQPLQCDLSMTWYKDQIDKAAKEKGLTWVLGDARCALKLNLARSVITSALTDGSHKAKLPEHSANCEVEYKGSRYPVKVGVSPEIEFRDGKATSVALGIHDIEANMIIKALIWSVAKVQEKTGAYQEDLVKGVNQYIQTECKGRPAGKRQAEIVPE